jgi:hypothetical protein
MVTRRHLLQIAIATFAAPAVMAQSKTATVTLTIDGMT